MKISILLPYKENFSPDYPGAVSIFVNSVSKNSKYKKNIFIYGSTNYKKKLSNNYINLPFSKGFFQSSSKIYVESFLKKEKENNSDIIEVHNRPSYINTIYASSESKIILYFHNDPLEMNGSKLSSERINLLEKVEKIIFNSLWSKKRFITGIDKFYHKSKKLLVIYQSINKKKINLERKQKLITFVGKLNKAKGYDIFGNAIIKILNKYPQWKSNVFGDEPREKLIYKHKNLNLMGFKKHKEVLKNFEKSSITVVCSRWQEPFGRTSLEAASNGCAVIISNKGGLPETITDGIVLKKLNVSNIYKEIEKLILDKKLRNKLQYLSLKNFYLTFFLL